MIFSSLGATFAYFSLTVGGNHENVTTTVKTAQVTGLNFDGESQITNPKDGAYPGWKDVQKFKLSVPLEVDESAKGGTYSITIDPTGSDTELVKKIKYYVYKTDNAVTNHVDRVAGEVQNSNGHLSVNDSLTCSGTFAQDTSICKTEADSDLIKTGTFTDTNKIEIETDQAFDGKFDDTTYFVVYEFVNEESPQDTLQGKTFTAKVDVSLKLADQ